MPKFIAAHKRQLITFLAAIVVMAGIVAGLWVTNVFGWRQWRVQEAQGFIGAPLPAGAADVQFTTRNTYTRILWLRFNMPADADMTAFLTQMGITDALKAGFTPFPAPNPQEASIPWWQPGASTNFNGLYWNTGSKIIEMLVDKTDSKKFTIFLRAYSLAQR
jgi:hypothetical protein